jgi:hypothetical protein
MRVNATLAGASRAATGPSRATGAGGMELAAVGAMDATPRISGLDFARGLLRVGHRMTGNACGYLLIERGSRAVTVPLVDELQPALLRFLLLAAGVSLPQLLEALKSPSAAPPSMNPPSAPVTLQPGRQLRTA